MIDIVTKIVYKNQCLNYRNPGTSFTQQWGRSTHPCSWWCSLTGAFIALQEKPQGPSGRVGPKWRGLEGATTKSGWASIAEARIRPRLKRPTPSSRRTAWWAQRSRPGLRGRRVSWPMVLVWLLPGAATGKCRLLDITANLPLQEYQPITLPVLKVPRPQMEPNLGSIQYIVQVSILFTIYSPIPWN